MCCSAALVLCEEYVVFDCKRWAFDQCRLHSIGASEANYVCIYSGVEYLGANSIILLDIRQRAVYDKRSSLDLCSTHNFFSAIRIRRQSPVQAANLHTRAPTYEAERGIRAPETRTPPTCFKHCFFINKLNYIVLYTVANFPSPSIKSERMAFRYVLDPKSITGFSLIPVGPRVSTFFYLCFFFSTTKELKLIWRPRLVTFFALGKGLLGEGGLFFCDIALHQLWS